MFEFVFVCRCEYQIHMRVCDSRTECVQAGKWSVCVCMCVCVCVCVRACVCVLYGVRQSVQNLFVFACV